MNELKNFDRDRITSLTRKLESQAEELPKLDRLLSMKIFCELTGWARTTVLRNEALGRIPRRRKLPNGQTAFLASEVIAWIADLENAPLTNLSKREAARRFLS